MVRAKNPSDSPPSNGEMLKVWAKIGFLSFGGPTAQISLMHKLIVEEHGWLSEKRFLNALSFCMLLPGPEAMQLATYAGWRNNGVRGGLAAGLLFVLPGAFVILALAMIYASFGNVPFVEALFLGIKACVIVIVIEALLRISKKALLRPAHWLIAGVSFVAIFFFALPYPLIVLAAGVIGLLLTSDDIQEPQSVEIHFTATLRTIATWLTLWLAPLLP